ncbi:hypothetical protein SERLA73DRAFT_175902, partial [Serpula lacrymans var. lacrymans S7.3]
VLSFQHLVYNQSEHRRDEVYAVIYSTTVDFRVVGCAINIVSESSACLKARSYTSNCRANPGHRSPRLRETRWG